MFFAGSQPIVTEACAPLDTAQQNVKKKTECKGTLGRMFDVDSANIVRTRTGICSALQGFRHGSGGAMFRTLFARSVGNRNYDSQQ